MTHEIALVLREGQYVTTRHELHKKVRRVTKVWVNADKTLVRIRINGMYGDAWLSPEEWELAENPWKKGRAE